MSDLSASFDMQSAIQTLTQHRSIHRKWM